VKPTCRTAALAWAAFLAMTPLASCGAYTGGDCSPRPEVRGTCSFAQFSVLPEDCVTQCEADITYRFAGVNAGSVVHVSFPAARREQIQRALLHAGPSQCVHAPMASCPPLDHVELPPDVCALLSSGCD
jgi:hypothetical protein